MLGDKETEEEDVIVVPPFGNALVENPRMDQEASKASKALKDREKERESATTET